MKRVETWLNEKEYKRLIRHTQKLGTSPYQFTKKLILENIESRRREYIVKMNIIYFYLLYSLAAATIVLLL